MGFWSIQHLFVACLHSHSKMPSNLRKKRKIIPPARFGSTKKKQPPTNAKASSTVPHQSVAPMNSSTSSNNASNNKQSTSQKAAIVDEPLFEELEDAIASHPLLSTLPPTPNNTVLNIALQCARLVLDREWIESGTRWIRWTTDWISTDWMEPGYFGRAILSHFWIVAQPQVIGWVYGLSSSNGQSCVFRMQS